MNILLLSTFDDRAGGAERVAYDLFKSYRKHGHDVRMAVRHKRTDTAGISELDPYSSRSWASTGLRGIERSIREVAQFRGQYRLVDMLRRSVAPRRWLDRWRGFEDFNYPASHHVAAQSGWCADIVHAHNLHGDYFDLRALGALSTDVPVVWTLHDAWALTGHCAYFVDCSRWLSGCGQCPDLHRPPAIQRDRTADNWRRKRDIYTAARLAVSTPSRWLMSCVDRSSLRPAHARVIPYGIDLSVYRPADKHNARKTLGLPPDGFVCLFVTQGGGDRNPYKDFTTVSEAVTRVLLARLKTPVHLVCLGGTAAPNPDGRHHHVGYVSDPARVALYYQAADVLLHAANADNFPCVILEALACGTPVIATSVGGIPEQITEGRSGFLVRRGDSHAMAERIMWLTDHPEASFSLREAAAIDAKRFGAEKQTQAYLDWFAELTRLRTRQKGESAADQTTAAHMGAH